MIKVVLKSFLNKQNSNSFRDVGRSEVWICWAVELDILTVARITWFILHFPFTQHSEWG